MGPEDTTDFSTLPNWPVDALAEDSKFGVSRRCRSSWTVIQALRRPREVRF